MASFSFEPDLAKKYGVNEAIFINSLNHWLNKNAVDKRNIYEGRPWTYNTHEEYTRIFPWLSTDQVKRIITKLRNEKVIETANYAGWNRRTYISLVDTSLLTEDIVVDEGEMEPVAAGDSPSGDSPTGGTASSNRRNRLIQEAISPDVYTDSTQVVNKKAAAGVRAREGQAKPAPAPEIKTPADIVIAFYESAGATRPPDDTVPWQRDIEQCEEILAAGYTADQIIGVPGMRSHTEISSFRYCSIKVLKQMYKHKPKPPAPSFLDGVTDTNKRIDEWAGSVPATDEERQEAIDACRDTLRVARGEAPPKNTSRNKPKTEPAPAPEPITITDDDLPF